jgi:hypothetical protein
MERVVIAVAVMAETYADYSIARQRAAGVISAPTALSATCTRSSGLRPENEGGRKRDSLRAAV